MSEIAAETSDGAPEVRRLTFDIDVEVCVVGGGLAGLSIALEAARMGASVALLEAKRIGWAASGRHLGTVKPGFDVAAETIVARIGPRAAAELWRMSQTGTEIVRVLAEKMAGVAMSDGALDVAASARGVRALDDMFSLGANFGIQAEIWDTERVREVLDTRRYFGALHYPRAFQVDAAAYLHGLVAAARAAGVRIFQDTPVTALDISGTRKRVVTPNAKLRAAHLVLAGNVHLGAAFPRLSATLLPVWRYGATTAPLGEVAEDSIDFGGSVADTDGIDHFRVLDDGRLMWASPETTWQGHPQRFAGAIRRRIQRIFPSLGAVRILETFGGAVGQTVHGMPQIGQLRPGLWVASGFGRRGLHTTAMAGRIIARGILYNDDRWRLFGPFDLIWAGGRAGVAAGYAIEQARRGQAATLAAWTRHREMTAMRAKRRAARIAAAGRQKAPADQPAGEPATAPETAAHAETLAEPQVSVAPPDAAAPERDPMPPSPFLEMPASSVMTAQEEMASQESERHDGPSA